MEEISIYQLILAAAVFGAIGNIIANVLIKLLSLIKKMKR